MSNPERVTQNAARLAEELVVALPHCELIRRKIVEFDLPGVEVEGPDDSVSEGADPFKSVALNLALLRLKNLETEGVTSTLRDKVDEYDCRPEVDAGRKPEGGDARNLDRLLYCLRHSVGADNGGWFPAMGKNRDMEYVAGQPHLSGTATEFPTPATRLEFEAQEVGTAVQHAPDARYLGRGVRVGILDTKLYMHPDLRGRYLTDHQSLLTEEDLEKNGDLGHRAGHCTFVAGLVNKYAPAAELDVRWVLSDSNATATAWDVARKMVEFKESGVQILVLALGGYTRDGREPLVLARAVEVLSPHVVLVAAAGNRVVPAKAGATAPPGDAGQTAGAIEPHKRPMYPAAAADVVAVGAVGPTSEPASFSPVLPWVTVVARGEDVVSTYLRGRVRVDRQGSTTETDFDDGYAKWSGTSFAAAIVAGRLAALASERGGDAHAALKVLLDPADPAARAVDQGDVRLLSELPPATPQTKPV
jgi:hypothetical protein